MTALTTTAPRTLAPTALDRALLGLSRMLARAAESRMRARAMRPVHSEARHAARGEGRSPYAEAEFYLRVR